MATSFTATPEPSHVPPRVRLDFDTGSSSSAFTSLTVRRDGVRLRSQPPTGARASVLYDYDAEFGESVTYTVDGEISTFTTVRDETWANLTGWSTYLGSPAVSSSKLSAGSVMRLLTAPENSRLTIHSASTFTNQLYFGTGSLPDPGGPTDGGQFAIIRNDTNLLITFFDSLTSQNFPVGTGDVVFAGNTVTTSTGTFSLAEELLAFDYVLASSTIPAFKIEQPTAVAYSATASAELDVTGAWLMHPVNPDLSVCISVGAEAGNGNRIYVEPGAGATVTYRQQRTLFSPLGRPNQVPVKFGPRRTGEWSMVLRTPRPVDRAAIVSLLADGLPVLLRVPPTFPWDLADGWYDVDDTDDVRVVDLSTRTPRTFTLPLIPVDEPVLTQGAQWTWSDVLATYDTWNDVLAAYDTWLDLLVGPTG